MTSVPAEAGAAGPGLAHGMGTAPVVPDWPPLTAPEAAAVLARYPVVPADRGPAPQAERGPVEIAWRSPRPFSAAALIRWGGGTVFLKRHDPRVRTPGQLAVEHAFATHLRARGVPAPAVLTTADGATSVSDGGWVYEAHEALDSRDDYREALSWTGYAVPQHARAAGAALARLHLAAADFPAPARPPAALTTSCVVVTAPDPVQEVARLARTRPGLRRFLSRRPWRRDLSEQVLPLIQQAAPALSGLPPQWGHGDWHPSNLTWTAGGEVAGVFDFGLANRTSAVHDIAVALERAVFGWLGLPGAGTVTVDIPAMEEFLTGYESIRQLGQQEAAALAEVLPVAHVEYALSEGEYFTAVTGSAADADLAYQYLVEHARWFAGPDGAVVLAELRRAARR